MENFHFISSEVWYAFFYETLVFKILEHLQNEQQSHPRFYINFIQFYKTLFQSWDNASTKKMHNYFNKADLRQQQMGFYCYQISSINTISYKKAQHTNSVKRTHYKHL